MSQFFTTNQIAKSIEALSSTHSFYGITFLTCKLNKLPIDNETIFAMDAKAEEFLIKYHSLDSKSNWFFQPYKSSANSNKWVRPDYPARDLQRVNTGTFGNAFIHPSGSRIWRWAKNYLQVLTEKLPQGKKIPAFDLAVWLFREKEWPDTCTHEDVCKYFFDHFNITQDERTQIFITPDETKQDSENTFCHHVYSWATLSLLLPPLPDSLQEHGGIISFIETINLGPSKKLTFHPGERLTIITGDNGLGKTFLLDCCWWALTGTWIDRPILPNAEHVGNRPSIAFTINNEIQKPNPTIIPFNWKTFSWLPIKNRPAISGLIIYPRVDGSFAIWDPAKKRAYQQDQKAIFTSTDIWDGLPGKIEGLIRDWVRWQNTPTKSTFEVLKAVLRQLSPPDMGILLPDEPVRVPGDPREIPTIKHPYGITPIINASAGVKRVISLAYLIVWAWTEHVVASKLVGRDTQKRIVILIDEIESHLHPKWQRTFLPALMAIPPLLSEDVKAQFIVATHSPMVMASSEEVFNIEQDTLVHMSLTTAGEVALEEFPFQKYGDVSSWLTSPIFEMKYARGNAAEKAIELAKELQQKEKPTKAEVQAASNELMQTLSPEDKFWPRWIFFAEQHGVSL